MIKQRVTCPVDELDVLIPVHVACKEDSRLGIKLPYRSMRKLILTFLASMTFLTITVFAETGLIVSIVLRSSFVWALLVLMVISACLMVGSVIAMTVENGELQKTPLRWKLFNQAREVWLRLLYCPVHDLVIDPITAISFKPKEMENFLYELI